MNDDLERILARVASGELSPDDAEPLVAATAARADPLADPTSRCTGRADARTGPLGPCRTLERRRPGRSASGSPTADGRWSTCASR